MLTLCSNLNLDSKKTNYYLSKLKTLDNQLKVLLKSRDRIKFVVIFLCSLVADYFVYQFAFISVEPGVAWNLMLYIYLPYSLAWLIRLTPGNIGIQEALMGSATLIAGLGSVSGVTLSILLRLINLISAFFTWILAIFLRRYLCG
jgi:hypothetical protein